MKIYSISLLSLKRKKVKTFLLIIGLAISISSITSMVILSNGLEESISKSLDDFGANVIISPKRDKMALKYGQLEIGSVEVGANELASEIIDSVKTIKNNENLSVISPKLLNELEIGDNIVLAIGIEFDNEIKLKKWWEIRGTIPTKKNQILLGEDVANLLKKGIGDTLTLMDEVYNVSAVLQKSGSQDDEIIFIDLSEAQKIFNKHNKLTLVELSALCYNCPIEEIVNQVQLKIPSAEVHAIKQAIVAKMTTSETFKKFSFVFSIVLILLSGLMVFVNINSSINERTKEIGIYKAIGFSSIDISKIILIEVILSGIIAGLLGYWGGISLSALIKPLLGLGDKILNNFSIDYLVISISLSIFLSAAASIIPIYRATRLEPSAAIRTL